MIRALPLPNFRRNRSMARGQKNGGAAIGVCIDGAQKLLSRKPAGFPSYAYLHATSFVGRQFKARTLQLIL